MPVRVIAKVLIVNDQGKLLCLVRSRQDENRPGGWDFPGGNVDAGEDFSEAVKREALEEAGVHVARPRLVYAASKKYGWGVGHLLFFVDTIDGEPAVTLSHEHESFAWLSPAELRLRSEYDVHHELVDFVTQYDLLLRPSTAS